MSEPFWKDDPTVLFNEKYITNFFPKRGQTISQQLNALMRLIIYSSILVFLQKQNIKYLAIPLLFAVVSIVIYNNPKLIEKYSSELSQLFESFTNLKRENFTSLENELASFTPLPKKQTNETCTRPTLNNPFMNPTINDPIVQDTPACDITEPDIKKDAENNFKNNLFRDTSDLCGKMNSQRQFYTIPNNDTISFANWLYRNEETCKTNNDYCLRYEDVRANRRI